MGDNYLFYEENIHFLYPSELVVKYLRFTRLMPPRGCRLTWRNALNVFIFKEIMFMPVTFGAFGYIIKGIKDGLEKEVMSGFLYILAGSQFEIGLFILFFKINEFENYYRNVGVYRFGLPRNLLKRSKFYQKVNIAFIIAFLFMACCHTFASLYIKVCSEKTLQTDARYQCDFGFPAWYPLKITNVYLRSLIIISRWFAACYITSAMSLYILFIEAIAGVALRMQHIRTLLRFIDLSGNPEKTRKNLIFCIRYHNEILRIASLMDNSIGYFLFPLYGNAVTLAISEYEVFMNGNIAGVFTWIIFVLGPIAYSECGQMLEDQSELLRQDVYGMNWYKMHPEIRNTFKLLFGKVQKPVCLRAYPLMILNRVALWNMMKSAINFLMFLQSCTK